MKYTKNQMLLVLYLVKNNGNCLESYALDTLNITCNEGTCPCWSKFCAPYKAFRKAKDILTTLNEEKIFDMLL